MKKLLLLAPMLMWSGLAAAQQQSEAEADRCTPATRPVIERVDIAPTDQPSATSAVLQVDIDASLPSGGTLNYDFHGQDGVISGSGSRASWTVSGSGPFNATVEVSAPGSACTAFAYLTYTMDQHQGASDGE